MSNQILVHGYIEMPEGSDRENAKVLAKIAQADSSEHGTLVQTFSALRPAWRSVMCSFAGSYKKIGAEDCQRLENEFERILKQLRVVSAHLSIEDQDSEEGHFIDYAYGPARFDGPDIWRRVRSRRICGESEELQT